MRSIATGTRFTWVAWTLTAVLFAFAVPGCGGDDDDHAPTLDDPNATAAELIDEYFTLLSEQDAEGLDGFLSDAFTVQRADGSTDTKENYLTEIPQISEFEVSDLSAHQSGDGLVVRYDQTVQETIGGRRFRTDPAPRLTNFVWEDGDWRLISHANFNAPETEPGQG